MAGMWIWCGNEWFKRWWGKSISLFDDALAVETDGDFRWPWNVLSFRFFSFYWQQQTSCNICGKVKSREITVKQNITHVKGSHGGVARVPAKEEGSRLGIPSCFWRQSCGASVSKEVAQAGRRNLVERPQRSQMLFLFLALETLGVKERASGGSIGTKRRAGQDKSGADQSCAKSNDSKRTKRERGKAGDVPGLTANAKQKPMCKKFKRVGWPNKVVVSHDTANCKAKPRLSHSSSQDGKGKVPPKKCMWQLKNCLDRWTSSRAQAEGQAQIEFQKALTLSEFGFGLFCLIRILVDVEVG